MLHNDFFTFTFKLLNYGLYVLKKYYKNIICMLIRLRHSAIPFTFFFFLFHRLLHMNI